MGQSKLTYCSKQVAPPRSTLLAKLPSKGQQPPTYNVSTNGTPALSKNAQNSTKSCVEGERSIKLHNSFIYICCSMRSEMWVPILWRSGTYNAQKADNRIISLLHPPAAIPKILFDISPTFLSTQSKNKCEEYLRTPRLWSRIGENLEVFVSTQHLQETKFEDICHIQIPLYLPLISSNVIELQYITQQ